LASSRARGSRRGSGWRSSRLWAGNPLKRSKTARRTAFPPVEDRRAEVLILGSFPSQRSLEKNQYYAHPRNNFWPIMGRVLGTSPDAPYAKKKLTLKANRIALWDVAARARRPGSLDSSIVGKSVVVNDFRRFFGSHPRIRLVCFNGAKAAELYRRRVLPMLGSEFPGIRYRRLPSTSPAHAAMPFGRKLARWRLVRR
jgi:double-stranded uracil-DNA glycosylase